MNMPEEASFAGIGPQQTYFEKLAKGRFEIQRCMDCSQHVFYPRTVCPHCGATALEWVAQQGHGIVYSTVVIRRKPEDGGDYNVALIDLVEGPRMMGRVAGVKPVAVRIGIVVFARIADDGGKPVVEWIPEGDLA